MARATAGRTTAALAATSDIDARYRELVAVHRRRVRAKAVAASAVALALVLVVVVGSGGLSHHRSEPIAPLPSTKPFRAAPPLCGPMSFGEELSDYVDVGGTCPTGPGRYLSLLAGPGAQPPFAFTLPQGWTIRPIPAVGGGPVVPSLGGLLLRSSATGDALVLTELPTEVPEFHSTDGNGETPKDIARRLTTRSFVQPTSVVRTSIDGHAAWRVDLVARPDTTYDGQCAGDRCAVTFALGRDYPGRSYVGLVPNVPSTAFVFNGYRQIVTVAWTWGDPDLDQELAGLLASIDLSPPITCTPGAQPCVG
jgi:hypothetical protein